MPRQMTTETKQPDLAKRYTLVLRSLPSAVPSIIRLRRLLKTALRVYSLRCTDVIEHPSHEQGVDPVRPPAESTNAVAVAMVSRVGIQINHTEDEKGCNGDEL